MKESGELDVTSMLQLAKQEASPSHFFTALRTYKGKPEKEGSKNRKEKRESTWCLSCGSLGSYTCGCEDKILISTGERNEIKHDAEKLRERIELNPESGHWRRFAKEFHPSLHEIVDEIETAQKEESDKAWQKVMESLPWNRKQEKPAAKTDNMAKVGEILPGFLQKLSAKSEIF